MNKKNILIIGMGKSGVSAAQFLLKKGCKNITGTDRNTQIDLLPSIQALKQEGVTILHEAALKDISPYDLVILSPGVPPNNEIYQKAQSAGIEIIGEIELACRFVSQKFIGITGTNGKTTVTLLTAHVLNQSGIPARALGNIGIPLTSELLQIGHDEILVVELSSFQLETLNQRVMDAAVILNITPDHLDRYTSMEEYAKAKCRIATCMKPGSSLLVEQKTVDAYGNLLTSFPIKTYGYNPSCAIYTDMIHVYAQGKVAYTLPQECQGRINHDTENQMAAYGLCSTFGVTGKDFAAALQSFKKPPHRVEFCRTLNGVSYYNDSKGTNIDAVLRAIASLPGTIILIAGGLDKGSPYTPWIQAFTDKVSHICAIGQAAPKIKEQLDPHFKVELCESLEKAVQLASTYAKPGDTVLLSPGCASYDMFKDYIHRGEEFKRIVNQLMLN